MAVKSLVMAVLFQTHSLSSNWRQNFYRHVSWSIGTLWECMKVLTKTPRLYPQWSMVKQIATNAKQTRWNDSSLCCGDVSLTISLTILCVFQKKTRTKGKSTEGRQRADPSELLLFQKKMEDRIQLFEKEKEMERTVREKVRWNSVHWNFICPEGQL